MNKVKYIIQGKSDNYFVLRPSKIHGIGVFLIGDIWPRQLIKIWLENDWQYVHNPSGKLLEMCNHYGVAHKDKYYSIPKNFCRMSIAWYLNHSTSPNAKVAKSGRCYAIERIFNGDELTIDYRTLDEDVDNSPKGNKV